MADFEAPDREPPQFWVEFGSTMTIGETVTLEPGEPAYVQNVGTDKDQVWNVGIPQGLQGPKGDDATINGYRVAEIVEGEGIRVQTTQGVIQISNTQTSAEWGNISGNIANQTDLQQALGNKQNVINDLDTIRSGASAGATALQPTDVINNTYSTTTNKPLSANMGKSLQDQVDNLKARGRFLALWNCATGLAETNPPESPYEYKTGDYFIVGTIASGSGTNYRPNGTSYTTGVASTTVETAEVAVDDVYYFDGTNWKLQSNQQKTVSFANLAGSPYDNTNLASALNGKVSTSTTVNGKALSSNITLTTDDIEVSNYGITTTYVIEYFNNANRSFGEVIGGAFDAEGYFDKSIFSLNPNNITNQDDIVQAIGKTDTAVGKVSTLTTTVKTDCVSAINEIVANAVQPTVFRDWN